MRVSESHIQLAVAKYFNTSGNTIAPNVSWAMNLHECDVLVFTKSGYLIEIEVKISRADILADKKKTHKHATTCYWSKMPAIKHLFFAIPAELKDSAVDIPEHAGVLLYHGVDRHMELLRPAQAKQSKKYNEEERFKLISNICLKYWNLKEEHLKLKDRLADASPQVG